MSFIGQRNSFLDITIWYGPQNGSSRPEVKPQEEVFFWKFVSTPDMFGGDEHVLRILRGCIKMHFLIELLQTFQKFHS